MRDTVYFLAYDGYADGQAALALCEIRRPGDWQLSILAPTLAAVRSMAGLQVSPDAALEQLEPARAALLLIPGGGAGGQPLPAACAAMRRVHQAGGVVAAIGTATALLAEAGLQTGRVWAGDDLHGMPDRAGNPAGALAVTDRRVISASAVAPVEFAVEVIRALDLYEQSDTTAWYRWQREAEPLPWLRPAIRAVAA